MNKIFALCEETDYCSSQPIIMTHPVVPNHEEFADDVRVVKAQIKEMQEKAYPYAINMSPNNLKDVAKLLVSEKGYQLIETIDVYVDQD